VLRTLFVAHQHAKNRGVQRVRLLRRQRTGVEVELLVAVEHDPLVALRRADLDRKVARDLPATYAVDLETELWRLLGATLLDPAYLEAGLGQGIAHHEQQTQERRERIAAFDAKLAQQRGRLDGIAGKLVDIGGGPLYDAMLAQAKAIEDLIDRLDEQRADLLALPSDGLSSDEAKSIVAFAAEMQTGLALATEADKRRLYDILHLHGTVSTDPDGIRLGQRHRYRIDRTAAIPLRDTAHPFLKSLKTYQNQYWTKT